MNKDIQDIVNALIEKSKAKQVHWVHASTIDTLNEEGQLDPSAQDFAMHAPTYTINIYRYNYNTGVSISIYNEQGTLVTTEAVPTSDPSYDAMNELLSLARRHAFGEDELLKKIKESLKNPGALGFSAENDITF